MVIDKLNEFSDKRGSLYPMDLDKIPFVPKRIFFVRGAKANTIRGEHAHKNCQQYYVCLEGAIEITSYDGEVEEKITLIRGEGIFIDAGVWTSENFRSRQSMLLVFASHLYDKNDYLKQIFAR